jgi:hypothetical protein
LNRPYKLKKYNKGGFMGFPAFDTLKYVEKLEAAGFSAPQAKAMSEAQKEVLADLLASKIATKSDIMDLNNKIVDLNNKVEKLDLDLNNKIEKLDLKFSGKFNLLYWMIAFALALNASILVKLFS